MKVQIYKAINKDGEEIFLWEVWSGLVLENNGRTWTLLGAKEEANKAAHFIKNKKRPVLIEEYDA